jgi:hypothetical protein
MSPTRSSGERYELIACRRRQNRILLIGLSPWPVRFRMNRARRTSLRFTLSLTLIVCLLPVPAAAHDAPPGPIAGAISREAARLVANQDTAASEADSEQQDTLTLSDWSRVRRLAPGTRMIVTVNGERPIPWKFRTADASQLTVHDATGHEEMIARSDVAEIETLVIRGSKVGAIVGAVGGAFLGTLIAEHLAFTVRCQPSCGGVEALIWLSAIGIPVAAGLGGYYASVESTARVIYRAP